MEPGGDRELIAASRSGDREAFAELARRWYPPLSRMAAALAGSKAPADDLVQEALMKIWLALDTFQEERPFGPWARRVLFNTFANDLRRWRREFPVADPELLAGPDGREDPEESLLAGERSVAVRRALAILPDSWRATLVLREVDGLSYGEIAVATGVSTGTVMSRLFRGRRRLAELLRGVLP